MDLGISLRGDLAKLSDAELAERLQQAWKRYEEVDDRQRSSSMFWTGRPTASLPLGYRIWVGFHRSPGFWVIVAALLAFLRIETLGPLNKKLALASDAATKVDDHIQEIQMTTDEIKRRVEKAKASA